MIPLLKDLTIVASVAAIPLAFVAPESRVCNAVLGASMVTILGMGAAIGINKLDKFISGDPNGSRLMQTFKNAARLPFIHPKKTIAAAAVAVTTLSGGGIYNDIADGRGPLWAVTGNAVNTVYSPIRWTLSKTSDLGQLVTNNLNPLPDSLRTKWGVMTYDGPIHCLDNITTDHQPNFTCSDLHGMINDLVDRTPGNVRNDPKPVHY